MSKKNKTAISPTREENFPEWYQQVIRASDLAENALVRGCMVIKPYGFGIWENIKNKFDKRIKECDVQNAYFPLLIPLSLLEREAEHVEGFAKECAVVTHHRLEADGNGKLKPAAPLDEPLVIRPTSETIIGESFSKWVQSYRDLPLKINQWANVMRWEMRPRMFLRTSEFLWQEGHNVFATAEEANEDAKKMLDVYADFAENVLAIPVIKGEKTDDERFPGAKNTYTIEAMMQDGKALQAGTSHDLGDNFAKASNIVYLDRDGEEKYAHTTSWGVSTRLIGGLIMTHGDDDGLIVPPRVAPYPIVIIPVIHDEGRKAEIFEYCQNIVKDLKAGNPHLSIFIDKREDKLPNKIWGWVKKGAPLRVEIGGREIDNDMVFFARRDLGKDGKDKLPRAEFIQKAPEILDAIQQNLFDRAKKRLLENITDISTTAEIDAFYKDGKTGFLRGNKTLLEDPDFAETIRRHALTPRCLPFDQKEKVIIAKAY
ncbi:MAG: proline--tRNA ligase [Alphaproteobacteria bacterium]